MLRLQNLELGFPKSQDVGLDADDLGRLANLQAAIVEELNPRMRPGAFWVRSCLRGGCFDS